ncbi:MAG: GNAT family N-acetyltransferase, partial [Candidatus Brocadiaceae bacterium]|nr:GNAT family N-acetyltransferase [Candidatus Brocadiaceae bacterium]
LGIRPDLAGRGMGLAFLEAILAFAREQYGDVRFRATIADFNARSRRVFEKAGFRHEQAFVSAARPGLEFVVVVKDPLSETAEDSSGG